MSDVIDGIAVAVSICVMLVSIFGSSFAVPNNDTSTSGPDIILISSPIVENATLATLVLFMLYYVLYGIKYRNGYLKTTPRTNLANPKEPRDQKEVKEEHEEWEREKTFSATLAGFSIASLIFILAFSELVKLQRMVEFFSISFILEMLSFLCYKYLVFRAYDYYGTVFQFAGLLAIINGFFVFISYKFLLTPVMAVAFIGGYIGFFVLTTKQLGTYIDTFRRTNNSNEKKK